MNNKQYFLRWIKNQGAYSEFKQATLKHYYDMVYQGRPFHTISSYQEWINKMFNTPLYYRDIINISIAWGESKQGSMYWQDLYVKWSKEMEK